MKTVVMVGANYLEQYDWPDLLEKKINIIILSGEYTKEKNKRLINDYHLNHKIIPIIPFPGHDVELFDEYSIFNACKELLGSENDLVLYTDDEKYMIQVAIAREMLNIDGPKLDDTLQFRDKILMREKLFNSGMNLTKYIKLDKHYLPTYREISKIFKDKQFVIKPTLLAGSFGFHAISSEEQYLQAIDELYALSLDLEIMAEAFMPGDLCHIDGVINGGELKLHIVCEYAYPNGSFKDGKLICSLPLESNSERYKNIYKYSKTVLDTLKPNDGSIHMEIFYEESSNAISFLEIANRPPGGHIGSLYKSNYKFNIFQHSFLSGIGLYDKNDTHQIQSDINNKKNGYIINGYIPSAEGAFDSISIPSLNGKIKIRSLFKYSEMLTDPLTVGEAVAYFEIENQSYDATRIDFDAMKYNTEDLLNTI